MDWIFDDSRPIWPQIKEQLMREIVAGRFKMGEPFPTVRDLAEEAKVNRNTMQRALSELETEGLIITNRTAGRTVTTDEKLVAQKRAEIAQSSASRFLAEMFNLGYDIEDVRELINKGVK